MKGPATEPSPEFQESLISFIWWGGLIMVGIGLVKLVIYGIGRWSPDVLTRIQSPTLQGFLSGKGNRIVFGWGGWLTLALGVFFMLASKGMSFLLEQTRL